MNSVAEKPPTTCSHHWTVASPTPGVETVPARCRKCRAKRTFPAFDAFYLNRGVDEGKPGKKHGPAPRIEPANLLSPQRRAKGTPA